MLGLVHEAYGKGGAGRRNVMGWRLEGELWEGDTVFGTRLQVVMKQGMMKGWRRGRFVEGRRSEAAGRVPVELSSV